MFPPLRRTVLCLLATLASGFSAPDREELTRGERLYLERCSMCHQPSGLGTPPVYPLDVVAIRDGRVFVLEYTRAIDFKSKVGWLPGRILELAATP